MDTIETIESGRHAIHAETRLKRVPLVVMGRMIVERLASWAAKRRSRAILRDLTEDQLCDIGLTRSDVRREVAKSFFWD